MQYKSILPLICAALILLFAYCERDTPELPESGEPQLLNYIDSMLTEVGVASYTDVLTGKLEGNFEFFSYSAPYETNCTSFIPATQLNGSVGTDSTHIIPVDAGTLYVNDLMITANAANNLKYTINAADANYATVQKELNKVYGKTNSIKLIKNDTVIFDKTLYIPKHIYLKGYDCSRLSMQGDPVIAGSSIIQWNADYNNKNGVIIQISGKDTYNVDRITYKVVSDIGKYVISQEDISLFPKEQNAVLGVKIAVSRGNLFFTKGTDRRKYNFTLNTSCDYYYNLK